MYVWQLFVLCLGGFVRGEYVTSCVYPNCRWELTRVLADNTKVTVEDTSQHRISWKWEVRGGHWQVTYNFNYPDEYYTGKAIFNNSSLPEETTPFVSWGSSVPWQSNAVPIYDGSPWNITYNGDTFGFVPTGGGRYIFRVYSRDKRHNPFAGSEDVSQPQLQCSLSDSRPAVLTQWWTEQKQTNLCPERSFTWIKAGLNGEWMVFYNYVHSLRQTNSIVYYQTPGLPQIKLVTWKLDELAKTITYSAFPIKVYENEWKIALTPEEIWGFTPLGNGLWNLQLYSRKVVLQPFFDYGTVWYAVPAGTVPVGSVRKGTTGTKLPFNATFQPPAKTIKLPPLVSV